MTWKQNSLIATVYECFKSFYLYITLLYYITFTYAQCVWTINYLTKYQIGWKYVKN